MMKTIMKKNEKIMNENNNNIKTYYAKDKNKKIKTKTKRELMKK